jgi:hypothetical protein
MGKAVVFYETDRRKIQENCEILAHQLQAGQRTRSLDHGFVELGSTRLRVVGYSGSLMHKDKSRSLVCKQA